MIDFLTSNDPSLAAKRNDIGQYITGLSADAGTNILVIILVVIIAIALIILFSHRMLKKDVKTLIKGKLDEEQKKQQQLHNEKQQLAAERDKLSKERDEIKNIFQKYVDPAIIKKIVAKTSDQKINVSVLVVDIRGFTALFEKMKPEEIGTLMDKYIDSMVKTVHNNDGIVQKIVGDMVFAIFGTENPSNHSAKALKAAIQMRSQILEMNTELARMGHKPIDVGIGISKGDVVLKSVGNPNSMLYFTALGEPISIAVKIEESAKAGEILISEPVRDELAAFIKTDDKRQLTIPNRSQPITAFRIKI
jgi:class 3 adenylate cyclase